MTRELLKRALDALGTSTWDHTSAVGKQELIDAMREALAAPQPEPVAWVPIESAPKDELILVGPTKRMGICAAMNHSRDGWVTETCSEWMNIYTPTHWMPLPAAPGAAPPAAPAPAVPNIVNPITDADIDRIADAVPVDQIGVHITTWHRRFARAVLSATPAVREPLTDEQIDALWRAPMSADWEHREFARAIEAHHGIGGGGNG